MEYTWQIKKDDKISNLQFDNNFGSIPGFLSFYVFLSKILPRCKNLRTLKLNYCNIGLDGMRALLLSLCDSTRDLCAVESLFIEHNHLDESIIPVVGMTLSKSENSVKTIRIGGHFDFPELLRKLELKFHLLY